MNVRPQHSVAEALYAEFLHSCTQRTRMEFKNLRRTFRPVDYSDGVFTLRLLSRAAQASIRRWPLRQPTQQSYEFW